MAVHPGLIANGLPLLRGVENAAETLDLLGREDLGRLQLVLKLVEAVRVRRLGYNWLLVVGLEGALDLICLIHEVEDKGVFLSGGHAVQAGKGLYGLHPRKPFIDVHRVEEWLIEACLKLIGGEKDLKLVRCEPSR